jgi:hypothetical protein
MKKFIGTKVIEAEPLNLGDYNTYRGWTIPENEDPQREGYFVKYPDGYESWSPKETFEEAYRQTDSMNFGLAIEAMKKGYFVARKGWNGKGMFVYLVNGATVPIENLRGNCAKAVEFAKIPHPSLNICGHIDMKSADGSIVVGWLASQTDMLADDWTIVI